MLEDFLPIKTTDKSSYEYYQSQLFESTGSMNTLSDLSFTNLYTWSHSIETLCKYTDGYFYIVIKLEGIWYFYMPFGPADQNYEAAIDQLFQFGKQEETLHIILVPEALLPLFHSLKKYKAHESYDRAYSDYFYQSLDFVNMLDKKSVRYDYNHFVRDNEPSFQLINSENKYHCVEIMEKYWCSFNDCTQCHFGCELKAIRYMTEHFEYLDCAGGLVYNAGEPIAFVTAGPLNEDTIVYHFQKSKPGIRGLIKYLLINFSAAVHKNIRNINYSEDMGLDGLRAFKTRLAPYQLVHKYDVILERTT